LLLKPEQRFVTDFVYSLFRFTSLLFAS